MTYYLPGPIGEAIVDYVIVLAVILIVLEFIRKIRDYKDRYK